MTAPGVRILVVDDHALVRKGLIQLLSRQHDFGEFGEAGSAAEAVALVARRPWDVLLLDLALPDGSGVEVLQRVRATHPHVPVLIVTMYPEDQLAERLLASGAAGYVTKEAAPEELVHAIRRVLRGQKYVSPALESQLASRGAVPAELPHRRLSAREFEVLLLLAAGRPVHVIARRLKLSPKTVTTYRARVLAKLHLASNAELTYYAVQHKLLSGPAFRLAM